MSGNNPSAVNQTLKCAYGGSRDNLLNRQAQVYGSAMDCCPVTGDVSLRRNADERSEPLAQMSTWRALLFRACRQSPVHR